MGAHRFLLCTRIFVSVGVIGKYSMSTWSAACNEQYAKEKEEKKKRIDNSNVGIDDEWNRMRRYR